MSCTKGIFVTGTDTGCGKTEFTLALMRRLQAEGLTVLGMKPVAAGAESSLEGLRNEDALRIQDAGSVAVPYELINPYAFAPPIAPHLAAEEAGREISLQVIEDCYAALGDFADIVVVEGAGGWRVPLNPQLDLSDLPAALNIPVVLVVGLRLGCLNHALLSAESILESGVPLSAWVANAIDGKMLRREENLLTLEQRIPAPLLGKLAYCANETGREGCGWNLSVLAKMSSCTMAQ